MQQKKFTLKTKLNIQREIIKAASGKKQTLNTLHELTGINETKPTIL